MLNERQRRRKKMSSEARAETQVREDSSSDQGGQDGVGEVVGVRK